MLLRVVLPEGRRLLDLGHRSFLTLSITGKDKRQGDGRVECSQRFDDGCSILIVCSEVPFLGLWVDVAKG